MTNKQFEAAVTEACKENLKPELDATHYASVSLDEMWDGEGYGDMHFEIRGNHTISGNPVTVSG